MKSTYNPKKAKECLEKELSILEALGPNYSDLKYDLMYLGLYDSMDGKFVQSLAKFERWLANFERNPAPSRVSAEAFIFMLVPVVELKLKSRQEDITERLVKIARRTAKTPREVAEVLDGWCYIVEERAPDSVKKGPFYQVATLLRKRALDEISNDYSQEGLALRSRILLNRGDNFVHDHQNDKATPCYLECLNFLERIKPDKSIKGTALTRLGFCVYRLDRKAEGLRLEAQGIKLLNEAAPQKWYAGRLKEIAREIADLKADTAAQNPTDLIQSHERLP